MSEKDVDVLTLDSIMRRELSRDTLHFYILDTFSVMKKYKQILSEPKKVVFGKKCSVVSDIDDRKKTIVDEYISIASKYYSKFPKQSSKEINNLLNGNEKNLDGKNITVKEVEEKEECLTCTNCSNEEQFDITENATICIICGMELDANFVRFSTSYKDSNRANINSRYTYDRRVHFRDCINQYQGQQNCTIPSKIYSDLEDRFRQHHLLVDGEGKEKFIRITKAHIMMFLKELKYSKQYENVNLIHYNLTGAKPDNISHLEDRLMSDFDQLIAVYDKKFKNKIDRKNFISIHFVLFQLLQRYNHPCSRDDFVMLKTTDRKNFHNDICKEIFQELGWNFRAM